MSFKHTVQMRIAWSEQGHAIDSGDKLYGLLALIAQRRVGGQPGRIEQRTIKRRPKTYPLLSTPRVLARAHVR